MDHRLDLWRRLRTARADSGASPEQVAEAMGWPIEDFLLVEAVVEGLDDGRLSALLGRYGLTGELPAPGPGDDPLSRQVRILAEYERLASGIRAFEPFVVPGLLQTPDYARVALGFYASPADLEPLVQARLARQKLFERDDVPEMRFLLDASALHRWRGATGDGPRIMREQADRLRRVARHTRVDIRVVPYEVGLHEGVKGPFVTLEFAERELSELLYLEDAKGDVVRAGPAATRPYLERFEALSTLSEPVESFLDR